MLPNAVHHDAHGQRIRWVGDGIRELKTSAACGKMRRIFSGDDLEKAARHVLAGLAQIAADGDGHILVAAVGKPVCKRKAGRNGFAQTLQLGLECGGVELAFLGILELFLLLVRGLLRALKCSDDFRRGERNIVRGSVIKNARNRVVITRRDRVELVIVTARARDGEPEESTRESIHAIRQRLGSRLRGRLRVAAIADVRRAHREKARAHAQVRVAWNEIARDLRPHKLVVRHVAIQRSDHPIAIPPRLGQRCGIELATEPVAVARDIEPVPPPALAVLRRSEQRIDDFCERIRRRVGEKSFYLIRSRRQSSDVEIRPADECVLFRSGRRFQPRSFQSRQHESIHRIPHPSSVLHYGRCKFLHLSKRPMLRAPLCEIVSFFLRQRSRRALLRP